MAAIKSQEKGGGGLPIGRRSFMKQTATALFAFSVGSEVMMLTPRMAYARGLDFQVLNEHEVATLEALGEVMVPGAREAGVAHFLDQQLATDPKDALLIIRTFDVEPPYTRFYRGGFTALDKLSRVRHGKSFRELTDKAARMLVKSLLHETPQDWQGPPAHLFYETVRSDAVDVVYGTMEGFENLGIPYMAHIVPPERW